MMSAKIKNYPTVDQYWAAHNIIISSMIMIIMFKISVSFGVGHTFYERVLINVIVEQK